MSTSYQIYQANDEHFSSSVVIKSVAQDGNEVVKIKIEGGKVNASHWSIPVGQTISVFAYAKRNEFVVSEIDFGGPDGKVRNYFKVMNLSTGETMQEYSVQFGEEVGPPFVSSNNEETSPMISYFAQPNFEAGRESSELRFVQVTDGIREELSVDLNIEVNTIILEECNDG